MLSENPRNGKRKPIVKISAEDSEQKDEPSDGLERKKSKILSIIENSYKKASDINSDKNGKIEEDVRYVTLTGSNTVKQLLTNSTNFYSNINERMSKSNMDKSKTKKKVKLITSALLIGYNKIRDIAGIPRVIDLVMFDGLRNLQWLDLQHNYLVTISVDIQKVVNLKTLYLHANFINNTKELVKLQPLEKLRSLTIHGNPLVRIPNFRLYIVMILPQLKKIDTVLISKYEIEFVSTWQKKYNPKKLPLYNDIDLPKPPSEEQTHNSKDV